MVLAVPVAVVYLGGFGRVVVAAVAFRVRTVESKSEIVVAGFARLVTSSPASAELSA